MTAITFNAKMVNETFYTKRKPTKVVQKSTGKTLARYESRRACSEALHINEAYISLLIYGRLKSKLVDEKYGELEIQDDPIFKTSLVPQEPSKAESAPRMSVTTYRHPSIRPRVLDTVKHGSEDDDIPF